MDLEEYLEFLKCHSTENKEDLINTERGLTRKMSSLKSFYNYFFRNERIQTNPAALVKLPKLHEKEIIRLEIDEVARLLDLVENGDSLTERQKAYHKKTRVRDLALMTLLLGTGIRVSECIGLNLNDVDFNVDGIRIHRKGGKEVIIYFGDEVELALRDYMEERRHIVPAPGNVLIYAEKATERKERRKSRQKICPGCSSFKKDYASQTAQYLRNESVPGNWRYLSGSRRSGTRRRKYDQEALCGARGRAPPQRQK